MYNDKVHVMLDFEMLGPGDQAKVIGVGAAIFGVEAHAGELPDQDDWRPFARPLYEAWPVNVKGRTIARTRGTRSRGGRDRNPRSARSRLRR